MTLSIAKQADTSGSATIVSAEKGILTKSGNIKIKGGEQSWEKTSAAPNNMKLQAVVTGRKEVLSEKAFTICAHPDQINMMDLAVVGPITSRGKLYWGARYKVDHESDSGVLADPDKAKTSEIVKSTGAGYWTNSTVISANFKSATLPLTDTHADGGMSSAALMKHSMDLSNCSGSCIVEQFFRYSCERCGISEDKINGGSQIINGKLAMKSLSILVVLRRVQVLLVKKRKRACLGY